MASALGEINVKCPAPGEPTSTNSTATERSPFVFVNFVFVIVSIRRTLTTSFFEPLTSKPASLTSRPYFWLFVSPSVKNISKSVCFPSNSFEAEGGRRSIVEAIVIGDSFGSFFCTCTAAGSSDVSPAGFEDSSFLMTCPAPEFRRIMGRALSLSPQRLPEKKSAVSNPSIETSPSNTSSTFSCFFSGV
eukprot:Lithocolla_globosa_v1_NODE_2752_length_1883_cov_5.862691.p2 type:complete len:189 gc:universal NODE_2752_length_1883_cov_5.862691:896-1462(+)